MGVEDAVKKFVNEPFIWVSMAMVGVVMMGPAAANLARKAVGGDRNRGNVDQHGETIVQADLKPESGTISSLSVQSNLGADRIAMLDKAKQSDVGKPIGENVASSPEVTTRNEKGPALSDFGKDEDLTGASIREEIVRRRNESNAVLDNQERPLASSESDHDDVLRDLQQPPEFETPDRHEMRAVADSDADTSWQETQPVSAGVPKQTEMSQQADSFDVEQMIDEVKSSTESTLKDSQPAQNNQGTAREYSIHEPVDVGGSETAKVKSTGPSTNGLAAGVDVNKPRTIRNKFHDVDPSRPASNSTADTDNAAEEDNKTGSKLAEPNTVDQSEISNAFSNDQDNESTFDPLDQPLTFQPESHDSNSWMNDPAVSRESGRMPVRDAATSLPSEGGETWWETSIAQQFWPDRQAQFASIDSVVFVALQNSAQIQILNDRPRIEETFVQQREADFDWSAFVDASWNSIDEPIRSELQTGSRTGRFVQEELRVGSGLQKRLSRGGELRVGSTIGTVDNNSIFLAPPDQGTATFSLDYRQPLLRGRGQEVTQSQIVLARLGVETTRHAVKQRMQTYLVNVVTAYWELYHARGVLSQRHRNFTRANQVVHELVNQGSAPGTVVQLRRARVAASARHSEVIDAEYVVADAQETLMNLTHGDNVGSSNELEIIPTDAPPNFMLPHNLDSVTEAAIRNRPEVKEVLAEIKAASVRKTIAIDGLKPQLDAIISSYVAGVRGDKDVGNAIYDQFSGGDPSYSVGMSFEIPIGRRSASAGLQREEIQRRLLQNKLRQTLGDVSKSARSAFRDVYRLMAITENNRHVVTESANALNAVQDQSSWLQKNNPSAALFLNDLLIAQDQLAAAEQNLLASQAQLAIAYVNLKGATGELMQDEVPGDAASCGVCEGTNCECSNVSHATWEQPIQQSPTAFEEMHPQTPETIDVPIDRVVPEPGVKPMPEQSDTAGEIFSAPRYPLSTQRSGAHRAFGY